MYGRDIKILQPFVVQLNGSDTKASDTDPDLTEDDED